MAMDIERVQRLTEAQRECLRRVFEHKSSKEIALELGKSRFTIDKRIEAALETLGVGSRIEAARLLARFEADYERFVCEPPHLGSESVSAILTPSHSGEGTNGGRVRDHTDRPTGEPAEWLGPARGLIRWPFPARGRNRNDLTTVERLIWIGAGALAIILLTFLALAAAESLQRTLWGLASRSN